MPRTNPTRFSRPTGLDRTLAERMVAEMPYPRTIPAYARFEVDHRGGLWIEEYVPVGANSDGRWVRLDPSARRAVAVRFLPRFTAKSFARGNVYGVWRDDVVVEHVHVHSLATVR